MRLPFAVLGSGSKANSYIFETGDGCIVIDNGFVLKDFKKRCAAAGFDWTTVKAVFLTHNHGDHVRGLETLVGHTGATLVHRQGFRIDTLFRKLKNYAAYPVEPRKSYRLGEVEFYPFDLSHDAPGAQSYHFKAGGRRFTLITDTGRTDDLMLGLAARSEVLFLESNYCPKLLEAGPYPPALRARVAADTGHLSNHQAAEFLNALADRDDCLVEQVYLVHLSENNNSPDRVGEVLSAESRWKGPIRVCGRSEMVVGDR
ncbi:MAG: MBL fold metallo-hydrolase [Spirochaetales bacterium]